jgi:hypothetical protein
MLKYSGLNKDPVCILQACAKKAWAGGKEKKALGIPNGSDQEPAAAIQFLWQNRCTSRMHHFFRYLTLQP